MQGSKDIKVIFHGYKTKNNKKALIRTMYISKTVKNIEYYFVENNGKKSKTVSNAFGGTVKQFYKELSFKKI